MIDLRAEMDELLGKSQRTNAIIHAAADEIDRLRGEVARLQSERDAAYGRGRDDEAAGMPVRMEAPPDASLGDVRRDRPMNRESVHVDS